MGGGHVTLQDVVRIRAPFERFPASIKGSFVMRGADGNPHQVRLEEARAVEVAGHGVVPMGVAPATLDVAPNRDLFVPFEVPVADLSPGWYAIEVAAAVDGSPATIRPDARFAVPWPRGATRRDQMRIGKSVSAAGDKIRLEQLECRADSIELRYEGAEAAITLLVDGARHAVLDRSFDAERGAGTVLAYPVLKSQERLTIAVKGAGDPVEIRLP